MTMLTVTHQSEIVPDIDIYENYNWQKFDSGVSTTFWDMNFLRFMVGSMFQASNKRHLFTNFIE